MPRDPMRLALFVFIVVSIARVHQLVPALAVLRPGMLTLAIASGFALLVPEKVAWRNLTDTWMGRAILAYAATTIFASFAGLSLGGSASYLISDFSKVVVSTFILLAALRTVNDLRFFLWAYVVSMAVWIYMAFFVFETAATTTGMSRLGDLYMFDANDLGVVLIMGLPFALILMAGAGRMVRLALWGVLLGVFATVALTGSRGALVGLGVLSVFVLVTEGRVSVVKRVAVALGLVGALVFAAPPGYWDQMQTIVDPTDDYNVTDIDGRVPIMKRGFGYFLERPLFGVGPNNFGRAEMQNPDKRAMLAPGAALRNIAPHNTYIQVLAELGGVGFFIWIYILLRGGVGGWRLRRRMPKRWARGSREERFLYSAGYYFPMVFLGFAVPSVFVSFAYISPPFVVFAFYGAFHRMAEARLRAERIVTPRSTRPSRWTERRPKGELGRIGAPALASTGVIVPGRGA